MRDALALEPVVAGAIIACLRAAWLFFVAPHEEAVRAELASARRQVAARSARVAAALAGGPAPVDHELEASMKRARQSVNSALAGVSR